MATTHIHHSPSVQRSHAYERREERTGYAAVWGILAIAVMAAVAYGFYGQQDVTGSALSPMTETSQTAPVGLTRSGSPANELSPSVITPGAPDTTTTESTVTPTDGIE